MPAFKVLNLKTASSRIISVLTFLSLGLLSLVAAKSAPPMPSELCLIFSYMLFGDFFYYLYREKTKTRHLALSLLVFSLSFFCPIISRPYVSYALYVLCIFLCAVLIKKLIPRKKASTVRLWLLMLFYLSSPLIQVFA